MTAGGNVEALAGDSLTIGVGDSFHDGEKAVVAEEGASNSGLR